MPPGSTDRPQGDPDDGLPAAVDEALAGAEHRHAGTVALTRAADERATLLAINQKCDLLPLNHAALVDAARDLRDLLRVQVTLCDHPRTRPWVCWWTPTLEVVGCETCVDHRYRAILSNRTRTCDGCSSDTWPMGTGVGAVGPVVFVLWLCRRCRRHRAPSRDGAAPLVDQLFDHLLEALTTEDAR